MAKSVIMLAVLKEKLDDIEKDCTKFDDKENLQAGMRVRKKLKKVRSMIDNMIKDTMDTSRTIQAKRGYKHPSYYWKKYKKDGREKIYRERERNAKKNKTKKL